MYLTSPGCPVDIGLQLGKACCFAGAKGRGGIFIFLLFLHFHSISFLPCPPLSFPLLSPLSLFSLSLDDTK